MNDCNLLAGFCDFSYPSFMWRRQSPRAIWFIFGMGKLKWLGIWWRSSDDRPSRLGTIHQRDRHTDSHVAITNAAQTHCVGRQKNRGRPRITCRERQHLERHRTDGLGIRWRTSVSRKWTEMSGKNGLPSVMCWSLLSKVQRKHTVRHEFDPRRTMHGLC